MYHNHFMNLAIRKAFDGIQKGQTPFGACIVLNDETLSCSHNMVWAANDITAHAEVCAIREACRKTHSIDLNGADIYSTCEPCPMCFSACHWAKIKTIYYAATIEDASKHGFNELSISNESMKQTSGSHIQIIGNCLRNESLALFEQWAKRSDCRTY